MAKIYGQLEEAQAEVLSSAPTHRVGRIYWDTSLGSLRVSTGSSWVTIGQATAGGGAGVNWFAGSGAPVGTEENGERVYLYESGGDQELLLFYKVPENYNTGNQIQAVLGIYSPSTFNWIEMQAVSTLIRKDTDAVDSTSLQHTKTLDDGNGSGEEQNTTANQLKHIALDITDASGQIASTAVSPGDLIKIQLQRGTPSSGADDTADVRFIPSFTEFTL